MDEFGKIMKKDAYTPKSVKFAQSLGLLHMRTTKASKFANEVMGATLSLKNYMIYQVKTTESVLTLLCHSSSLPLNKLLVGSDHQLAAVPTMP